MLYDAPGRAPELYPALAGSRVKNHGDNGRVGQALHALSLRAAEAACGKSRPQQVVPVVRVLFVDPGGIAGFTLTKVPNESRVVMRTGLRPLSHRHQAQCLLSARPAEVTDSCEAFAAGFEEFGPPEPSGNERCGRACAEGISASRSNVKPGEMNPGGLIGCPLAVGIQTTFGGNTPLILGRVY